MTLYMLRRRSHYLILISSLAFDIQNACNDNHESMHPAPFTM
jgi:hypothetical protein